MPVHARDAMLQSESLTLKFIKKRSFWFFCAMQTVSWIAPTSWSEIRMILVQVDFDGLHPLEGAKQVKNLMTRYVTRALRAWSKARQLMEEDRKREHKASSLKTTWNVLPAETLYLKVDPIPDGNGLVITGALRLGRPGSVDRALYNSMSLGAILNNSLQFELRNN
jgi:hypothetical protein